MRGENDRFFYGASRGADNEITERIKLVMEVEFFADADDFDGNEFLMVRRGRAAHEAFGDADE
jgi:hypothetical protein